MPLAKRWIVNSLKTFVVLVAVAAAALRLGFWSVASQAPSESSRLPARAPLSLAELAPVLDEELAPMVKGGVLDDTTGCGLAIGIIDHGDRRILTYGAARPDSIFQIGSITKTFTGFALAQLVVQGKVQLDDPVSALLFPDMTVRADAREITLLDLATHHSGLPSLPDNIDPKDSSNPFAGYDRVALRHFLEIHGTLKPAGAGYLYSSFGIALLADALAARAGVPYPKLIADEVTGPFAMIDTVFALAPQQAARALQGHDAALAPLDAGSGDNGILAGAVGAKSTTGDLLAYLDANLDPGRYATGAAPGSPAATIPAAIALEHKLQGSVDSTTAIALIWLYDVRDGRFEHGGTTPGFTAHIEFTPAQDRGIVVLYNRSDEADGRNRFVDRVARNVDELMSGLPAERLDYPSLNAPSLAQSGEIRSDL